MLKFLKQVGDYAKEAVQAGRYIGEGLSVTFDHMRRRPITVQYPYEKLIPGERFRGRIHFEFDKCISCNLTKPVRRKSSITTVLILEFVSSAVIVWNIAQLTVYQ